MDNQGDSFNGWQEYMSREDPPAWTHPAFADAARIANATRTQYMQHAARWQAQQRQGQGQPGHQSTPGHTSHSREDRNNVFLQGSYGQRQPVQAGETAGHLPAQSNTEEASSQQYVRPSDLGPSTSHYSSNFSRRSDIPFTTSAQLQNTVPTQAPRPTTTQDGNLQSPFQRHSQPSPIGSYSHPRSFTPSYTGPAHSPTPPQPSRHTTPANRPTAPPDQQRDHQTPAKPLERNQSMSLTNTLQNRRESFLRDEIQPVTSPNRDPYTSAARSTLEPDPTRQPQKNARVAMDQHRSHIPPGINSASVSSSPRSAHTSTESAVRGSWNPKMSTNLNNAAARKTSTSSTSQTHVSPKPVQLAAYNSLNNTDKHGPVPSKEPPSKGGFPSSTFTPKQYEPSRPQKTAPDLQKTLKSAPNTPSARPGGEQRAGKRTSTPSNPNPPQSVRPVPDPGQAHEMTTPSSQNTKAHVPPRSSSPPRDPPATASIGAHSASESKPLGDVQITQTSRAAQIALPAAASTSLQSPGQVSQRSSDIRPSTIHQSPKQHHFVTGSDPIPPSIHQRQLPAVGNFDGAAPPPEKARKLDDGSKQTSAPNKVEPAVHIKRRIRHKAFQTKLRQRHDLVKRLDPIEVDPKEEFNPATIARDVLITAAKHPFEEVLNHHLFLLLKNLPTVDLSSDLDTVRWDLIDPVIPRDPEPVSRPPHRPHVPPPRPLVQSRPPMQSLDATRLSFPGVPGLPSLSHPPFSLPNLPIYNQTHRQHSQPVYRAYIPHVPPPPPHTSSLVAPAPPSCSPVPALERSDPKSNLAAVTPAVKPTPQPNTKTVHSLPPSFNEPSLSSRTKDHPKLQVVIQSPKKMPPVKKRVGRPRKEDKVANVEVAIPTSSGKATPHFPIFNCAWRNCPVELHNLPLLQSHIKTVHIPQCFTCEWKGCTDGSPKASAAMEDHIRDTHISQLAWALGDGPTVLSPAEDERSALSRPKFDLFHHNTPAGTVVLPADPKLVDAFSRSHGISEPKEKAELFKNGGRHWKEQAGPDVDISDRRLAAHTRLSSSRVSEMAMTLPDPQ
ncbi:hypothetical protein N7456_012782 [Penicillium angulare]|uniref:C2H2-type domain-containing protein n=1 Tax=Penicillium angulare TaxID=116970 RepID=A0A9W9JVV1_9EURO|nr:hypothetical protein N7456_012782 [Penicillium angulare]